MKLFKPSWVSHNGEFIYDKLIFWLVVKPLAGGIFKLVSSDSICELYAQLCQCVFSGLADSAEHCDRTIVVVVKSIATYAGGLGYDSRTSQICRFATAVPFLWSCVTQARRCGDGPRRSLHNAHSGVIPRV